MTDQPEFQARMAWQGPNPAMTGHPMAGQCFTPELRALLIGQLRELRDFLMLLIQTQPHVFGLFHNASSA